MEGNSTSAIVAKATREMDESLAGVMPSSWHGHARLIIADSDLSNEQREFATRLSERLLDKGKVATAKKAGALGVTHAREKLE